MTDFLLELRSEEIPARMQEKARADLAQLFAARLEALNLEHAGIESFATPRRLALIVRGVAEATTPVTEERKGPRADAPAQAVEGFLRSTGLSRDQLVTRDDGKGGQVLFAVIERPGLPAPSVLANACQHVIHAFPWPKSMRWGAASTSTESLRWVRPLQGIVALFGDAIVPFEVAGVASGAATVGHRFHHPGMITIGSAADYAGKLRACHVIVDGAERRGIIALGAKLAAQKAGLALIEDDGLLYENAGLTEWPVPLLGRFDAAFLEVPPEVIQLTARVNQKYFVCRDGEGKLANAFVCVANIDAADGGAKIVEGNQKVLAARLSDARFFYETDLKTRLEDLQPKLEKIVFHEKLGTVAYRIGRTSGLAVWLLNRGYLSGYDQKQIERAALLAKTDLVTGTVGEFPELQATVGSRIARSQGEPDAIVVAIRDQYRPVGPSDSVPREPLAVALALSDKLQVICGFFSEGLLPTGSSDPFALRRTALGIIRIILENNLRLPLRMVVGVEIMAPYFARVRQFAEHEHIQAEAVLAHVREFIANPEAAYLKIRDARFSEFLESLVPEAKAAEETSRRLLDFLADRLKVQQREAGVRHDLIDAVFALGGEDDLVRLLARVHALQAFVGTEDGKNLLAGYKRAANILKKESFEPGAVNASPEPAERTLAEALDAAEPRAAEAIAAEDFEGAMAALSTLRGPIDAFFHDVTVNDADRVKRAARLGLLTRMRDAVHKVADFSKIEG